MTKTTFATLEDQRAARATWWVVDASEHTLGRMATRIAQVLMGKHKPLYTPHLPVGDGVIVLNAGRVQTTGTKRDTRVYTRYTGWIGGQKTATLGEHLEERPAELIKLAVRRMLPKTQQGKNMLSRLKVYEGEEHPHTAQQPQPLTFPSRK